MKLSGMIVTALTMVTSDIVCDVCVWAPLGFIPGIVGGFSSPGSAPSSGVSERVLRGSAANLGKRLAASEVDDQSVA